MRRLKRSKGDRALLEGPHLVAEALAAGRELEEVLVAPGFFDEDTSGADLRRLLAELPTPPLEVAPELLDELADADAPRGLVAVARLPRGGVDTLPAPGPGAVFVWLDGLQDPGNLGAVARAAEAAGAAGLALGPGSVHPNHPRALRGSAGSLLRLPAARDVEPDALEAHLAAAGAPPRWIALVPRDGADLWTTPALGPVGAAADENAVAAEDTVDAVPPLILAVGAEGPGLSPALVERAVGVTIPLAPPVESLNAAVAAALVLFEIARRRAPTRPMPI